MTEPISRTQLLYLHTSAAASLSMNSLCPCRFFLHSSSKIGFLGRGGFRVEIDFCFVEVGTLVATIVELEEPVWASVMFVYMKCQDDILTM